MKTDIFPIGAKKEWNELIGKATIYDFYHCASYNNLEKSGAPFLFVVQDEAGAFIAIPLLKRSIDGTGYFDCTSAYGYPGPFSNIKNLEGKKELLQYFHDSLLKYAATENIVTIFSRLHPIIEQAGFFNGLGEVVSLNKTVAIDLTLPLDMQRRQYRKSNKSEVNQLRKNGFVVKEAADKGEIDTFIAIYTDTMKRVNAHPYYFFDAEYFYNFLNSEDYQSRLLLAFKDGEITAGAIFTVTKAIMQYHLAGTKEEYMKVTPMKLIIDEARLLGTDWGLQYLHLGGGVGGSENDSLFAFKAGFSDLNFTYKVWKLVVDEAVNNELVQVRSQTKAINKNYFPLYRG